MGNALRDAGLAEQAVSAYAKAIQCDPMLADAYANMGIGFKVGASARAGACAEWAQLEEGAATLTACGDACRTRGDWTTRRRACSRRWTSLRATTTRRRTSSTRRHSPATGTSSRRGCRRSCPQSGGMCIAAKWPRAHCSRYTPSACQWPRRRCGARAPHARAARVDTLPSPPPQPSGTVGDVEPRARTPAQHAAPEFPPLQVPGPKAARAHPRALTPGGCSRQCRCAAHPLSGTLVHAQIGYIGTCFGDHPVGQAISGAFRCGPAVKLAPRTASVNPLPHQAPRHVAF